jgi:hypothetical protein
MHVNLSPKFVRMSSNFIGHANENKSTHAGMDAARLVWQVGARGGWGWSGRVV